MRGLRLPLKIPMTGVVVGGGVDGVGIVVAVGWTQVEATRATSSSGGARGSLEARTFVTRMNSMTERGRAEAETHTDGGQEWRKRRGMRTGEEKR